VETAESRECTGNIQRWKTHRGSDRGSEVPDRSSNQTVEKTSPGRRDEDGRISRTEARSERAHEAGAET
jgi:hypothetical protein